MVVDQLCVVTRLPHDFAPLHYSRHADRITLQQVPFYEWKAVIANEKIPEMMRRIERPAPFNGVNKMRQKHAMRRLQLAFENFGLQDRRIRPGCDPVIRE